MVVRRCPQCHTTGDDKYGFCIKCGYEFSKAENAGNVCPLCNYPNPDEADYCVKCGSPLLHMHHMEGEETSITPIIIKRSITNDPIDADVPHTSRLLIGLGYVFSLLGGLIGLIIAIYLITRRDPVAKKHGRIQLGIFIFYLILILIFILTGAITSETLMQYTQMTGLQNLTNMSL